MRLLFTALLFFTTVFSFGQKCKWLAFTDCGALINTRQLCTDKVGNVYVGGEYKGEALFHSAQLSDTAIDKFTSENTSKLFIARYDENGRLTVMVQFRGESAYLQGLKVLPNGNMVVFVRGGKYGLDFVDPLGNHVSAKAGGRTSNLFCIDPSGNLVWSVCTMVLDCKWLEVAENGTVYVFGDGQEWLAPEKWLLKFSASGVPLDTLASGGPALMSPCFHGNKLYVLASNGGYGNARQLRKPESNTFLMPQDYWGLYELDTAHLVAMKLFERSLPINQGYDKSYPANFKSSLNYTSSALYVDILLQVSDGRINFMNKQYYDRTKNLRLFRLNAKGDSVTSAAYSGVAYNNSLTPGENGSVYLLAVGWGKHFAYGNDSIALPKHGDFINELIILKLDSRFKLNWMQCAGATASNYHSSLVERDVNGKLFVVSDLLEPGTVFGRELKMQWRSLMYVGCLEE